MCPAERLFKHFVYKAKLIQLSRRNTHGLGGILGLVGALPENGGAAFRRNDGVDAVLQHQQAISDTDGQGTARTALADNDAYDGCPEPRHPDTRPVCRSA